MLVVVPALCGGAVGLVLVAGFGADSGGASGVHFGSERSGLKPIPIPQRACPYLDAVRKTGDAAGRATTAMMVGLPLLGGANRRPLDLSYVKAAANSYAQMPQTLAAFDLALRAGATQVPAALRVRLKTVALDVELGRHELERAPDAQTYVEDSFASVVDGLTALSDASDLVGNACGFELSDYSPLAPR